MSLNWVSEPCEACTTCNGCGEKWCREDEVSPGESDGLCVSCYETDDDIAEGKLRARDYEAWADL